MYDIGDKVVCPMYGAGEIISIEEKEILGEKQKYYVLRVPMGDMNILIPVKNVRNIGIRKIISKQDADRVFPVFSEPVCIDSSNWNKRYRDNMLKIKSGDIFKVADVVKTLLIRDKERGLSTGERKLLNNSKKILYSELILATNKNQDEIEELIESSINSYINVC